MSLQRETLGDKPMNPTVTRAKRAVIGSVSLTVLLMLVEVGLCIGAGLSAHGGPYGDPIMVDGGAPLPSLLSMCALGDLAIMAVTLMLVSSSIRTLKAVRGQTEES